MALSPHKYSQVMLRPGDKLFSATNEELRAETKAKVIEAYGSGWVFVHEQRDNAEGTDNPPGTFVYTSMWSSI